jgi:hypothetical protein
MNNIFLPCFKIDRHKEIEYPSSINEIEINFMGERCMVNNLFYSNRIELKADSLSASFKVNTNQDVVVKDDYVLAVVNSDILTDMNIPVVSVTVVRETDFLR